MSVASDLIAIFSQTLLPVFLIAGAGYLLSSRLTMDGKTLGRFLFYLATPSLVFRSLYQMEIDMAALQHLALVVGGVTLSTGLLGWLLAAGASRQERAALTLSSAVSNNGNMGIPICLFAFGAPGLSLGSLYYVINSFLGNTVGVLVASSGHVAFGAALRNSLRVPVLYAAVLGLFLNQWAVELPLGVFRGIDLLANGAIPGMLVLLGVQLSDAPLRQQQGPTLRTAAIRLLLAPLLAAAFCFALGITGIERNVLILQAAMPTAVMSAVLATEYNAAPRLVATVIFVTTALSVVSLSVVLWFILT